MDDKGLRRSLAMNGGSSSEDESEQEKKVPDGEERDLHTAAAAGNIGAMKKLL